MNDVSRALTRLVDFAPLFTRWAIDAMAAWNNELSPQRRARQSAVSRDNFIYDEIIASARTAVTPLPIRIRAFCRMRWIVIEDGGLNIAIWSKKVRPHSLLTSIYPTDAARKRQRNWNLFAQTRSVLFVCGHTIYEDIAGADAWIDKVVLTQEKRDAQGKRGLSLCRPVYHHSIGHVPLQVHDGQSTLFDLPTFRPAAAGHDTIRLTTPPRAPSVRARKVAAKPAEPGMPKVGLDAARREAEEKQRQAEQERNDGAKGA